MMTFCMIAVSKTRIFYTYYMLRFISLTFYNSDLNEHFYKIRICSAITMQKSITYRTSHSTCYTNYTSAKWKQNSVYNRTFAILKPINL